MNTVTKKIHDIGIVPVIARNRIEDAAPLAKAMYAGGLPIAEIIFRNEADHDLLVEMKNTCPEMMIGAGSILTQEQVDSALNGDVAYISTQGLDPNIVKYCQDKNIPVIPEISNAGDMESTLALGIDTVKFLPAEHPDGIKMIKMLSNDYDQIKFIPSVGINQSKVNEYLNEPCVLACCGSWMIDENAISEKNFGKIRELAEDAVSSILGRTLKHIGINDENEDGAELADRFAGIFGGKVRKTVKGWFGSEFAEIMSKKFHTGRHGHIGIGVNNPDRARRYYEALGYSFDERTAGYDENGALEIIYFSEEIGGFALHIVKK
ncbi:MAG: bifunctional 4-hydroxy-2-oxoglutarate aldolase/2-dehydro-3-deoxy-phosphogluconate aldolase [Anaerolineaceae bacterium]|nr:bifunctional 4-hydroxy-2-oxoglutarate aldolase/2-dehydro-3-deoxy-phosphogluconate aldolase [Anaerolineaceae bacterium]